MESSSVRIEVEFLCDKIQFSVNYAAYKVCEEVLILFANSTGTVLFVYLWCHLVCVALLCISVQSDFISNDAIDRYALSSNYDILFCQNSKGT